MNFAMLPK